VPRYGGGDSVVILAVTEQAVEKDSNVPRDGQRHDRYIMPVRHQMAENSSLCPPTRRPPQHAGEVSAFFPVTHQSAASPRRQRATPRLCSLMAVGLLKAGCHPPRRHAACHIIQLSR